jgi:glycosyltransferase involved in cell wall biosynthesis
MRLAFLTPLPPAATGIADYSVEVLELLAARYAIDVYHDQEQVDRSRLPQTAGLHPAGELIERHRAQPYDLVIHQLGNGLAHARVYDLLPQVGGLLVLHDLVLHHARARQFLGSAEARAYAEDPSSAALRAAVLPQLARYQAELAYNYPAQATRLGEAQLATVGTLLPYAYPLFRLPVEAARAVAVHNAYMARAITDEVPGVPVVRIPMRAERVSVAAAEVARIRERHGLAPGQLVVGSFGLLTREKQIETVARAVARAAAFIPQLRLMLVGPVPDEEALTALLTRLGIRERTIVTGRVPFTELAAYMQAVDLVVHLRYPTARETSAALLRVLAQGRPTVMSDWDHLADIPDDAVVRVPLTDEEGSVTRAILRLAERPQERRALGANAAHFMVAAHSAEACLEGYVAAIERALVSPQPEARAWPAHWRPALP